MVGLRVARKKTTTEKRLRFKKKNKQKVIRSSRPHCICVARDHFPQHSSKAVKRLQLFRARQRQLGYLRETNTGKRLLKCALYTML